MVDHLTKEKRSWNMSRIRSKDTKPEKVVRSLLHSMGYRFRLNGKVSKREHPKGVLPGKPDIVLAGFRTVVFVHGCFWHRHKGCKGTTTPKSRTDWWLAKFKRNTDRDKKNQKELKQLGWTVITIWECEVKDEGKLRRALEKKLNKVKAYSAPEIPDYPKAAEKKVAYE